MVRNSRPMDLQAGFVERRAPEPEKWHLSKSIPIGLIITLLVIAFSGVQAFFKHERDIDLLKAAQASNFTILANADISQISNFKDALSQLREQYTQLNSKIDRLIEVQMTVKEKTR